MLQLREHKFTATDVESQINERKKCVFNGIKVPTTYIESSAVAADLYFGTKCCKRN